MTQKYHHPSLGLRHTLITAIALITLALLCTAPAAADTNTIGTPVITAHPQSSEYPPNTPCIPLSVSAEPPEGGTGTLSCQWQKSTRPDFADIELSPKQTFDKSTTYPIPNSPPGTTSYYRANISYTENGITTWVLSNYAAITTHHIPPQYTAYWFNTTTTAINLTLSPTAGNADSVYIKLGDKQSPARSGPFTRGITITNFPFSGLTPGQTYELTAYIKYQNTDQYTAQPLDPITAPVPDEIDIVPGSHGELPLSGESCIFPPGNTMTFSAVTQNNSDSYPNIFQNDPVIWNLQGTNTTIIAQTPTTITLKSGSTAGTDTLTAATQNGLLRSEPIPLIVDPDKVPTELRIEIAHPVPLGDTTYLVAAAFSEDDLLFLGYDLTVTGISLPTSKIPAILYFTPTEAKTISAAITVNGKKISSTTENVTVIDKPAITSQQTADAVYFESDTPNPLSVTVSSPGSGPLTYQWQKSTDPTFQANVWNIEGATTPTYTPTIQIPESGISPNITYYRAKITYTDPIYNMISTYAYSRIAKITVLKPTPDTITLNPSELTIEKGTTAHITATAQNSTRPDLTCDHPIAWSIETGGEYLTLSQNKNEADITAAAEGVAVIRVTSGDAETRLTVIVTDASSPAQKHLITATAGPGGTISPNGDIPVVEGTSQTFTIIPDRGYRIADVTVNGTSVGAVTSYTFPSVSQPYTIAAAFTNAPAPEPEPQPPQPPATSGSSSGNMDNAFRVLFDTSGGSFISPVTSLSYGDKITAPPAPTKDGCTFGGWYKDEACTQEWNFSEGIPGDITLYARWTSAAGTPADPTPIPTAPETAEPTTVPETHHPTTSPTTTTAAGGVTPTLTQAPAPVLGALLGLLAAGALLRRRD
ncbi:InlB B-repeat-containing protein [Methanocorpusculum vombati]|uniref:InlB B-repeat-containing protein n=1 Tax=Methanocorpusculum vombati TaxID=3002864 RepID=A0ABT4INN0_9EURY|nr:InlB B-repeat-containing protein [Methanocorpusculum vombati]MCZ0863368.1 InlB B-repeat-containing protein [Methanocorpusculum vombati]MDE2548626.1 InlB B-repeat-containing protein [Methanocorpusculum sp.]